MGQILEPHQDKCVTYHTLYEYYKEDYLLKSEKFNKEIKQLVHLQTQQRQYIRIRRKWIPRFDSDIKSEDEQILRNLYSGKEPLIKNPRSDVEKHFNLKLREYNRTCSNLENLRIQRDFHIDSLLGIWEFSFVLSTHNGNILEAVVYDDYVFKWFPLGTIMVESFYMRKLVGKFDFVESFRNYVNIVKQGLVPYTKKGHQDAIDGGYFYNGVEWKVKHDGRFIRIKWTRNDRALHNSMNYKIKFLNKNEGVVSKLLALIGNKVSDPEKYTFYFDKYLNRSRTKKLNTNEHYKEQAINR